MKRSIDAAGNAASGHKMFIATGSDFSGGKVWGGKRGAETRTAAQMGGGGFFMVDGGPLFDYAEPTFHLIPHCSAIEFHSNIPVGRLL